MALQVPSGLVTTLSGAGGGGLTASPQPVVIVGAGAGFSGLHTINDTSGALWVNVVSGSIVSVSGDIVLVVSGGTIQVSGTVSAGILSGNVSVSSGEVHVMSGSIGANVSGIVGVSGNVAVLSGNISVSSGAISVVSGSITINSGTITASISSGAVSISSGNATVSTSGANQVTVGVSGGYQLQGESTTNPNLRVSIYNAGTEVSTANAASDGADGTGLLPAVIYLNPGGNSFQRARSVTGSSGGSTGVLAVQTVGYTWSLVSGAVAVNIKSGSAFLHAINVNSYSSGGQFEVMDSASGISAAGRLGTINPDLGTIANTDLAPASLLYDALMISGIVISTSGANWNLTILWRTATS